MSDKEGYEIVVTDKEVEIFNMLIEAYNKYMALPKLPRQFQKGELNEFCRSIQNAQRVVIARAILRIVHEDEEE